ncbi:MAG: hypothetical protein JWM99_4022 [Verrucomicrobiales bacterium]|jgi:hypothetical protein|nr:hypothetical protein [Verrucomicrobiales bacterium]
MRVIGTQRTSGSATTVFALAARWQNVERHITLQKLVFLR